jgi:hypothetical protein
MNLRLPLSSGIAAALWMTAVAGRAASFSSEPFADAFVTTGATGNFTSNNFGAAGALGVAAAGLPQGEFQTVMQFDLSAARLAFDTQFGAGQWAVQSATLRLTAAPHSNVIFNNIAPGLFGVSLMQNNSWVEGTGTGGIPTSDGISYNSLQGVYIDTLNDQALGTFSFGGTSSGAANYSLTLAPGLVSDLIGGGDASLRMFAADGSVSYLFDSRTGGSSAAFHPSLILDVVAVPEPGVAGFVLGVAAMAALRRSRTSRWREAPDELARENARSSKDESDFPPH